MLKRLIALCALISVSAEAGSLSPLTTAGTSIIPGGASIAQSLGALTSANRNLAAKTSVRVWKPYGGATSIDTSGSLFFPSGASKTATLTIEVDDQFSAARIWFANGGTNAYTITDCAISGSSLLEAAGYTGGTPGITPYDLTSTALTTMQNCSFGNNGANYPISFVPQVPASSVSLATGASSTGTTLNFTTTTPTGVTKGQRVVIPATSGTWPALSPEPTYVTAASSAGCSPSCTVTISQTLKNTVPSGTTVYFLPIGISVPASASPPVHALVATDWIPTISYDHLADGWSYPLNGWGVDSANTGAITGLASNTTVNGTPAAGSIPITPATTAPIPAGTTESFCTAFPTNAALSPATTLSFTNTAGVVAGMYAAFGGNGGTTTPSPWPIPGDTFYQNGLAYNNIVASVVSNTSVSFANGLPSAAFNAGVNNFGATVVFMLPVQLTANAANGATSLTVQSGLNMTGGGVLTAWGTNVNSGVATVTSYNAGTGALVISSGLTGSLNAGAYINVGVVYASSASITDPTTLSFASNTLTGVYNGMYAVGANIPAYDTVFISSFTGTTKAYLEAPPTGTVASGASIQFCKSWTVNANVPAGATSLPVNQPKRLLFVRVNIGSSYANYNGVSQGVSAILNALGQPYYYSGRCAAGTDGVLNVTSISNTAGSCAVDNAAGMPEFMIETYSPRLGSTVCGPVQDSHGQGNTTPGGNFNYVAQSAYGISTPSWPVSYVNLGWGGANSDLYQTEAYNVMSQIHCSAALVAGWTFNDSIDDPSSNYLNFKNDSLIEFLKKAGTTPIIAAGDYVRQKLNCSTVPSALSETYRETSEAYWNSVIASGTVAGFDPTPLLYDANNPTYLSATLADDCVHANYVGHGILDKNGLRPVLRAVLGD